MGTHFFPRSREAEKTIPKSAHPKTWDFFFISPPYWFTQAWKQTLWVIVYCLGVDLSSSSFSNVGRHGIFICQITCRLHNAALSFICEKEKLTPPVEAPPPKKLVSLPSNEKTWADSTGKWKCIFRPLHAEEKQNNTRLLWKVNETIRSPTVSFPAQGRSPVHHQTPKDPHER